MRNRTLLGYVVVVAGTYLPLATAQDLGAPGIYAAGRTEVVVTRSGGGTFPAQVYYPAEIEGIDTTIDSSGAPYPGIVFAHGFLGDPVVQYESTLRHLATHGYVVIAPQSFLSKNLGNQILAYAADLTDAMTHLESATVDPGSFLFSQVDSARLGYAGHSMGGSTSIHAAAADGRASMLVVLGPFEVNPSAIAKAADLNVPFMVVSGTDDELAPVPNVPMPMYDNAPPPKTHVIIDGGWHCGFLDVNLPFCDPQVLPRAQQLTIARRNLVGFANLYLKQDRSRWAMVWGQEATADPLVSVVSDPGIGLTVQAVCVGVDTDVKLHGQISIVNDGDGTNSFSVFAEENTWSVAFDPTVTPDLTPGESTVIDVEVFIPIAEAGLVESHVWGVWSHDDGGTHAVGSLDVSQRAAAFCCPAIVTPAAGAVASNRFLAITPPDGVGAIRVTLGALDGFAEAEGRVRWAGAPVAYPEIGGGTLTAAQLQCEPSFSDWGGLSEVFLFGGDIIPRSSYEVDAASDCTGIPRQRILGGSVTIVTQKWGDLVPPFWEPGSVQPNFSDIAGIVQSFLSAPGAPSKAQAQLQPNIPKPAQAISFRDIADAVQGFLGNAYPYDGPSTCP